MAYCYDCRRPFTDQGALDRHLRTSSRHSWCGRCIKAFNSEDAKKQHLRDSKWHNVCLQCPPGLDFQTERELNRHVSVHNAFVINKIITKVSSAEENSLGYHGISPSIIKPVYAAALRLRFQQPTVDVVVNQTKTTLDHDIVSALISGALRLLPVDSTPQGVAARKEREIVRAAEARRAEQNFFADFRRLGYDCISEDEQKRLSASTLDNGISKDQQKGPSASTPDILFKEPTIICGHLCWWLEYKNFFGFKANPFLAQKNKKQFRRYAEKIGPGVVVYKLGFETGHVNIEGVEILREQEVRKNLAMQTTVK